MKPTLLVIQENSPETTQLVDYMSGSEYFSSVDCVSDGQAALDFMSRQHIDVVITDLILPVMDGITFIRKSSDLQEIAPSFYVLTSLSAGKIISEAFASGAEYCFIKPCHPSVILEKIQGPSFRTSPPSPITTASAENSFRYRNRSIDERITSVFISVGIPAAHKRVSLPAGRDKISRRKPAYYQQHNQRALPVDSRRFRNFEQ